MTGMMARCPPMICSCTSEQITLKTHPSLSHACTLHWIFRKRIGVEFFGSTFTAPLSGIVQARPASRDTWLSWLQFGSGTVIEEMSPYREDQVLDVLRGRVRFEGWEIVAKYGRRGQYEIRARAWKFSRQGCGSTPIRRRNCDDIETTKYA